MDSDIEKRIIERASELFLEHGIKTVTMDDVARETGTSKRTLYELFSNKDHLLFKTLEYQEARMEAQRKQIQETCFNSFELTLKYYELALRNMRAINRNYLPDLKRYHPTVSPFLERNNKAHMQENINLTEQGIRDGYIRAELNSEILALLLHAQLELLIDSKELASGRFSMPEVFETIIMNYARGIATPEGLEMLEEYSDKNE